MNQYLKNLNKIEFVVTYACTGRCKHCSEGNHTSCGERIDPQIAADAVRKIAAEYDIKTVMTFGGEPLLYTDAVYAIMETAKELNIPKRQVITNGYFSKNIDKIREVAEQLAAFGVNDLLLSVDVFHQETIPLDVVKQFAVEAKACGIPIRLQPAWLVSATDDNPYNRKTREILDSFADMDITANEGNIIFPEGNALKYLAEYFTDGLPENPYVEDPRDVRCVSFSPNGDVLGGNMYERDIMEMIENYAPQRRKIMTNQEILKIAMAQSAIDLCAAPSAFEKSENVVVMSHESDGARRYLKLPFSCQLVSYGNNVVASVSPEFREITEKYINQYPVEHLFETPHLHVLNDELMKKGQKICFMAEYFLPDVDVPRQRTGEDAGPYKMKWLTQADFADLYLPEWSNALCEQRRHLDVLGVGAYDGDKLVGLAGCSADCDTMWQIGVDVLPAYRRQGIASVLTSRLAIEILNREKVPFYCAAWCNIRSVRNAIKSGFRPAWVEMTAKSWETVDGMNKR